MSNDLELKVTLRASDQGLSGTVREVKEETGGLDSALDSAGKKTGYFTEQLTDADRAAGRFYDKMGRLRDANGRYVKGARNAKDAAKGLNDEWATGQQRIGGLTTVLGTLASALSIREVLAYKDSHTSLQNQLRDVTGATESLADVNARLDAVAEDSRSGLESTVNLYARLTRSTSELGLSQEQVLRTTETINKAFALSGATSNEANAAIIQLGQGLAAGALRGDEFNSVAEQAPEIMRAIASHLNLTIGELRDFAAEGGITAKIVVDALDEAAESIDTRFGNSIATFGQHMQEAQDNVMEFLGTSSDVQSLTDHLGAGIVMLSENVGTILYSVEIMGTLAAAYWTVNTAIRVVTSAQLALNAATLAHPAGAIARGLAVVTTAIAGYVVASDTSTASANEHTAALNANTSAIHQNAGAASLSAREQIKASIASSTAQLTSLKASNIEILANIQTLAQQQEQFKDNAKVVTAYAISISNASLALQTNKDQIADITESIAKMQKNLDTLNTGRIVSSTADANQKLIDLYAGQIPRLDELRQHLATLLDLQNKYPKQAKLIALAIENINRMLDEEEKRNEKKIDQNDELIKQLEDEIKLLGLSERQRAIEVAQRKLSADATEDQHKEIARLTGQIYDYNQAMQASEQATKPWLDSWEGAAERLDETFANLWAGSTESFGDQLLNSFKKTLAEMAHLATTKKLVIGVTTAIGETFGIPGTPSAASSAGGAGNILSTGSNLYNLATGGLTTAIGYGSTFTSSMAAGAGAQQAAMLAAQTAEFGASGAALTSSALGGTSSTAGALATAAPWVLGGIAAVAVLNSIFGDKDLPPGFEIRNEVNQAQGFKDKNRQYSTQSILGGVGFSTNDAEDQAAEFAGQFSKVLDSLAAAENAIASTLSPEQVDKLVDQFAATVDDTGSTIITMSRNPEEAINQYIGGRFTAIFDVMGGELDQLYDAYTGKGQDLQSYALGLVSINEALNDATLIGRLLPDSLTAAVGAVTALANEGESLAETFNRLTGETSYFYQNFYTEQERAQQTVSQLSEVVAGFNSEFGTAIQSKDDLRAFVEALDLTSAAGQKAYQAAMQLAPQMVALSNAMTTAGTSAALEIDAVTQDWVSDRAKQIADNYKEELAQINQIYTARKQQLQSEITAARQIRQSLTNIRLSEISPLTADQRVNAAQSEFARLQVLIENGNLDAAGQVGNAAQQYLSELSAARGADPYYVTEFDNVTSYLEQLGLDLGSNLDPLTELQRIEEEMLSEQKQLLTNSRNQLDLLARQYTELTGIDDGLNNLATLLGGLPNDIRKALEGIVGGNNQPSAPAQLSDYEFVSQLYTDGLGRSADSSGLAYWLSELAAGKSRDVVRDTFYKAAGENGESVTSLSAAEFVSQLYTRGLGRAGDQDGLDYWLSELSAGKSRDLVKETFFKAARENGEQINYFANGGVVTNPQTFGFDREVSGNIGQRGEAGAEAIIPVGSGFIPAKFDSSLINEVRALRKQSEGQETELKQLRETLSRLIEVTVNQGGKAEEQRGQQIKATKNIKRKNVEVAV